MEETANWNLRVCISSLRDATPLIGHDWVAGKPDAVVGYTLALSPERMRWLIEALHRALDGDTDPFRLRQRGRPRKATTDNRLYFAAVLVELLRRKRGVTLQDAAAAVAEQIGICERALSDGTRLASARWFMDNIPEHVVMQHIERELGIDCKKIADLFAVTSQG